MNTDRANAPVTGKHTVLFLPAGITVEVQAGTTLLAAARRAKVHLPVRCEGKMGCLMCKLQIVSDPPGVLPPAEGERRKLGASINGGTRLACQARVCGSVSAEVPEDPLKRAVRLQLERKPQEEDDFFGFNF
ncbi:2Fe-2S iron-sulfur cluster binding domain-containing protein [Saccharibacillus sp. CPCC 101409]|uniref:2Fe-2S iron-sulfur cluster binding domain-containing protein n=1 Tax=Saccharibacillus sp. CPCC 101409 TaxID=3058041 RepID=UPI002672906A|nr:2Fe-2S iron-sulfur cluster binding domain-containing protein [Saccharibacillus sp. CPCC 101409]MDO3409598.1 2Fe-2S iron-sulfur cluster binding domain-containing protein [Saccharibacillus sp. CPCC 101409]